MAERLSSPSVLVNNNLALIKPNTFEYVEGQGEYTVEVQSGGGGTTEGVFSENAETKKGMAKFSMLSTEENLVLARQWKTNFSDNVIVVTVPRSSFTKTFNNATMVNDPPKALSQDGEFEVEFHSNPAV